jgi:hypothetical protein
VLRVTDADHESRNGERVFSAGVLMKKQQTAILALILWLILVLLYMLLSTIFDLQFFFILCMIGVLVIMQLIEPKYVKPGYLKYIWYLIALGILVFGAVVVVKVMEILGLEFIFLKNFF